VGILDLGFCKECMQNVFFPKSKIQDPRVAEKSCAKGPKFKIQDPKKEFLNPRGWD